MAWDSKRRAPSEYINHHKAQRIIVRDHGVCYLCHHHGATQVDHVVPWAEWSRTDMSVHDQSNLAAVHGGVPCPVCGASCHEDKSKAEAARGVQRRVARGKRPAEQHPGRLHS